MPNDELTDRKLLVSAAHQLLSSGLVRRSWGNLSLRRDEEHILITPSGLAYDKMTPEDIVLLNLSDGSYVGRKPSSEKAVHFAAYRQFSDCRFVLHTHQDYATALGLAPLPPLGEEGLLGGVSRAAYGISSTKDLARKVEKEFRKGSHTVLMIHHGVVFASASSEEAFSRAQILESMAKNIVGPETAMKPDSSLSFPDAVVNSSPAALLVASQGKRIPLELDDVAQILGRSIPVVTGANAPAAFKNHPLVFVEGLGAVIHSSDPVERETLLFLSEKVALAHTYARRKKVRASLGFFDILLQHFYYVKKYAKRY